MKEKLVYVILSFKLIFRTEHKLVFQTLCAIFFAHFRKFFLRRFIKYQQNYTILILLLCGRSKQIYTWGRALIFCPERSSKSTIARGKIIKTFIDLPMYIPSFLSLLETKPRSTKLLGQYSSYGPHAGLITTLK